MVSKVGQNKFESGLANSGDCPYPAPSRLSQDNRCTDSQWFHHNFALRPSHEPSSTAQELRTANEDIDRYSGYIAFTERRLVEVGNILATPGISTLDRRFALSDRETKTKFLHESQENLEFARHRLNEILKADRLDAQSTF